MRKLFIVLLLCLLLSPLFARGVTETVSNEGFTGLVEVLTELQTGAYPVVEEPFAPVEVEPVAPVEDEPVEVIEPVVETTETAEPVVETTEPAQPVIEVAETELVVNKPVVEESNYFIKTINVFGYEATIEGFDNIVKVTYPNFVTYDELKAAALAAYEAFPQYLENSTIYIDPARGTAVVTLAFIPTVEDAKYAVEVLEAVIPGYIMALFSNKAEEVTVQELFEMPVEVVSDAPAEEEVAAQEVFEMPVEVVSDAPAEEEVAAQEVFEMPVEVVSDAPAEEEVAAQEVVEEAVAVEAPAEEPVKETVLEPEKPVVEVFTYEYKPNTTKAKNFFFTIDFGFRSLFKANEIKVETSFFPSFAATAHYNLGIFYSEIGAECLFYSSEEYVFNVAVAKVNVGASLDLGFCDLFGAIGYRYIFASERSAFKSGSSIGYEIGLRLNFTDNFNIKVKYEVLGKDSYVTAALCINL